MVLLCWNQDLKTRKIFLNSFTYNFRLTAYFILSCNFFLLFHFLDFLCFFKGMPQEILVPWICYTMYILFPFLLPVLTQYGHLYRTEGYNTVNIPSKIVLSSSIVAVNYIWSCWLEKGWRLHWSWSRIHERTVSLRSLSIILRFPYTMFT